MTSGPWTTDQLEAGLGGARCWDIEVEEEVEVEEDKEAEDEDK